MSGQVRAEVQDLDVSGNEVGHERLNLLEVNRLRLFSNTLSSIQRAATLASG